ELRLAHARRLEQRTRGGAIEVRIVALGQRVVAAGHLPFRVVSEKGLRHDCSLSSSGSDGDQRPVRRSMRELCRVCQGSLVRRSAISHIAAMTASLSAADLQPSLAGRYEIERELGHGGMATVFLARDL